MRVSSDSYFVMAITAAARTIHAFRPGRQPVYLWTSVVRVLAHEPLWLAFNNGNDRGKNENDRQKPSGVAN